MIETFRASRFTSGNCLWPTVIELTEDTLVRRKRRWFTVDETRMHLSKVASVHVTSGLLFTDIRIESSGGCIGFEKHLPFAAVVDPLKNSLDPLLVPPN